MKRAAARLSFAVVIAFSPTITLAQSSTPEAAVIDDLIQCMSIDDDQSRLQCYDSELRQLADLSAEGPDEAAQTFTGRGEWQSEPFVMDAPWRLAWQSKTDLLTIQMTGPTALQQQAIVDNQIGAAAGRSSPQEPGEYRLIVRALGEWQIFAIEE